MKGLELAKKYYETFGKEAIHASFSEIENKIAIGLIGQGSECYGFDDDISTDHDFEPGFCVFLPDESIVDEKTAFQLERLYAKLPKEFEGFKRGILSPVGGNRHGVFRLKDYLNNKFGLCENPSLYDWFSIPEHALAEFQNGAIFADESGLLTSAREVFSRYPEDVRRKKLASALLTMAQSGQYNFSRCIKHGEYGAARLALCEFVKGALQASFLLENTFMPYYKWQFKALRALPIGEKIADSLEFLMTGSSADYDVMADVVEEIATNIITALQDQNLTKAICGDLEKHAYSVNDSIADANLRNEAI